MKINDALSWATKILKSKQIDFPRLDAEILLAFTLKKPREFLLTHLENKLTSLEISKYRNIVNRRARREPIAYLTHKKEFYGLEFIINKNVLIPRPETETLVDEVLKYFCTITHDRELLYKRKTTIIDVGTGSGCVAIAIAKSYRNESFLCREQVKPSLRVRPNFAKQNLDGRGNLYKILAIDSSDQALRVAKKNAKLHDVSKDITFLPGNLLEPVLPHLNPPPHGGGGWGKLIIVANLPYLTPQEWSKTQPEIKKYEPRNALVGGRDGLKYYKMLLKQLFNTYKSNKTNKTNGTNGTNGTYGITCFFEINPQQKKSLKKFISTLFPKARVEVMKDLGGLNRILKFELRNY